MKERGDHQEFRKKVEKKGLKHVGSSRSHGKGRMEMELDKAVRAVMARQRAKRTGLHAVKLHLETTGGTGRTSRSATSVRKTSVRMTAIKEYPFDLSDVEEQKRLAEKNTAKAAEDTTPRKRPSIISSHNNPNDGKRKVSIMADENSKDRETLQDRNSRISSQADGPSRRKSNLHNAMSAEIDSTWVRQGHIEGRFKKHSTHSSIYSKKELSHKSDHIKSSWWYACCAKCNQEESGIPSWEPPNWQKICPYPLCPSYRQFAQTLSVFIIGILAWLMLWIIMGETAAPGGQLFMLVVLTIAAYFGGWLMMKITTLPALIGMLFVGIIMKNVGFVNFDQTYEHLASYVRKIALTIIFTRAGLDLDPVAMKNFFFTVIKLALIPWTFEACLCAIMAHFLLDLPWNWAFLLGSIVAAVAPAVVVPCLFRLRARGYGVSKGIPTLVLAVAGIDDAASVAAFGIVFGLMFSNSSLVMNIVQGPISIFGGILFGGLCGYFVKYVPERHDGFLVPLRVLLLLTGGLVCVLGSEEIGWGGAGPLAVLAFAFVSCKNWTEMGWDLEDNPVATAFEIFWMLFEPMLFAITGAQVVIAELELHLVLVAVGILMTCMVLRTLVTVGSAVRSNLNTKEKFFVGLAWMAKAIVQAALGPIALDEVKKIAGPEGPSAELVRYAETVATVCIVSIVISAPIGAIAIAIAGPHLLSKTSKPPAVLEGWRRSHRPSFRDMSIIDENGTGDKDLESDGQDAAPSPTSTPVSNPVPITVQPNQRI